MRALKHVNSINVCRMWCLEASGSSRMLVVREKGLLSWMNKNKFDNIDDLTFTKWCVVSSWPNVCIISWKHTSIVEEKLTRTDEEKKPSMKIDNRREYCESGHELRSLFVLNFYFITVFSSLPQRHPINISERAAAKEEEDEGLKANSSR